MPRLQLLYNVHVTAFLFPRRLRTQGRAGNKTCSEGRNLADDNAA